LLLVFLDRGTGPPGTNVNVVVVVVVVVVVLGVLVAIRFSKY